MPRLELLDMPLEVASNIFQLLPGKDQKNLALTCSAVLNIVAPTLYSAVRLYYDEPGDDGAFNGLPRINDIQHLISSQQFPLAYAKHLSIERKEPHSIAAKSKPRPFTSAKNDQIELTEMADRGLELILKRFGDNQLKSIRLAHQTTYKTFALICKHQKKLRKLDLGHFKPGGRRSKVPNQILTPGSLGLEFLEIRDIDDRVTCLTTVMGILHQNSATLRRLRIGDPKHPGKPRLTASSWARRPRSKTKLPFAKIDLLALKQISIIHDHSAERFWDIFQNVVHCGGELSHIRISCFTDPYVLVQKLVAKGADGIKSIQISNCRRRGQGAFQVPVHNQLPRLSLLETVQLQMCTHEEGEFLPAYISRSTTKRLWLQCTANCDPTTCRSMSGLLDTKSNITLSPDNWPMLEELAIGAPQLINPATSHPEDSLSKLPMLASLKVLRLLQWQTAVQIKCPPTAERLQLQVQAFVDTLYSWCAGAYKKLPNLRLIVVDTEIGGGCPGTAIHAPLYFVVYHFGQMPQADGIGLPLTINVDYDNALKLCNEVGCSSYLLEHGPPAPEGLWDDYSTNSTGISAEI
ncbi:hypothetical protein TWF730_006313 [Orbilia blumenaviensis]|uniref:F-box domain-containing protein n=1 Tax=Orbilia blumenaviensis TaxID=1796055 RepID=A0AAV9VDW6_9PEZI